MLQNKKRWIIQEIKDKKLKYTFFSELNCSQPHLDQTAPQSSSGHLSHRWTRWHIFPCLSLWARWSAATAALQPHRSWSGRRRLWPNPCQRKDTGSFVTWKPMSHLSIHHQSLLIQCGITGGGAYPRYNRLISASGWHKTATHPDYKNYITIKT